MPTLEDPTGWRDELRAYWDSDEYKALDKARRDKVIISNPNQKIPFSRIVELAEVALRTEEVCRSEEAIHRWALANPDLSPSDDPEGFPWDAQDVSVYFIEWYRFKTGLPSSSALRLGPSLAMLVRMGTLASPTSPATRDRAAHMPFANGIDFDN